MAELIEFAAQRQGEEVYEPLDHIEPGLPRTLIHVSGSEVLLTDARKAAHMLAAAGVPVEVRVWPGQMHVFQLASPAVKEAERLMSLNEDVLRYLTVRVDELEEGPSAMMQAKSGRDEREGRGDRGDRMDRPRRDFGGFRGDREGGERPPRRAEGGE